MSAIINIKFLTDLKQFSTQMQNASRSIKKVGKQMQNVGAALSVSVTAPFTAFAVSSVKNWDVQAKAIAQVEAGLRSTGNAVGYNSEQLQQMASELQNNTLFGDEEILKGVTSQLLTFTNIAGEQFKRTQQAALDLSTRLDGDLKGASIQLGKALNDPIAGVSALGESGIQFTQSQKATIKTMVETNRLAEAQTLILNELENQYGGSAAAAAKAGTGPLKQLANSFGDLKEEFGKIILEAIIPFVDKFKGMVAGFQALSPEAKKFIVILGGVAAVIGPLLVSLGFLMTTVLPGLKVAFLGLSSVLLANPIGALITLCVSLSSIALVLSSRFKELTNIGAEWNDVTRVAIGNIAKEKSELERNLVVAKDESRSKRDRLDSINKLKNQYPEYLGFLSLESLNTEKAKKATDLLVASLLRKAKVQAAQEKLVQVEKKLLDLQLGQSEALKPSLWQNLGAALKSYGNISLLQINRSLEVAKNYKQEKTALESLRSSLHSYLSDNKDIVDSLSKVSSGVKKLNADLSKGKHKKKKAKSLSGSLKSKGVKSLGKVDFSTSIDGTLRPLEEKLTAFQQVAKDIAGSIAGSFEEMGSNMLDSFGLADTGFQGFVKSLGGTIIKLISMLLSNSLANVIAGATQSGTATGPAAIFTTPAFIATAVSGVVAAFAAIPKFETGGVVGGSSFFGDKLLARVNSGELILNQRQQQRMYSLITPASQAVNVSLAGGVEIDGRKLKFLLNQTDNRLKRTS